MKQLLFFAAVVVLFINCNNSNAGGGWSAAEKQKGLKDCLNEVEGKIDEATGKKYCGCVLEKAMVKYKTYQEAEKGTEEEGRELGLACANMLKGKNDAGGDGGLGGKDENDLTEDNGGGGLFGGGGDGWSNSDRKKYMNECTPAAAKMGVSEQAATAYCNCTLKRIEKKFKSYSEAEKKMTQEDLTTVQQACAGAVSNDDGGGSDDNN